ncbi:MAG: N-acetylmuramoyl-L-alanine amidase [Akkermansia sp.]|nr:N-acetylmuramoyl-L-alanine amidase [Akkermansia sp.]MBR2314415.1 N-acetylmuramoyl-L-alanine amidase [Akkermansia sp.]
MQRHFLIAPLLLLLVLAFTACQQFPGPPTPAVVLDIGHTAEYPGARTPGKVNGRRFSECEFWYEYAYYTKKVIEEAGFPCVVSNRGSMPDDERYEQWAERADVQHLRKREKPGRRYPSRYFPDRVASGIISADYGVYRQAPAMVFLHHNSSASGWRRYNQKSIILANRHNGTPLAQAIADSLNSRCLNHGMPNKGRKCQVQVRYVDASRGGGWLNVCDDAGIPAAIIEAAFLNNRQHARYLANPANARRYAEAVGHGVVHYLRTRSGTVHHRRNNVNEPDEGSFGYARESRRLDVPGAKHLL